MACLLCIIFILLMVDWLFEISWWFFKLGLCLFFILFFIAVFGSIADAREYDPAEIVLIGKVVHHEAENQSELGKRLVADTILNRIESPNFPDTVEEVISQPGQYCDPTEYPPREIYTIVAEEIYTRTNNQVLYFKTKGYHSFATPIVKEGDHYFSGR